MWIKPVQATQQVFDLLDCRQSYLLLANGVGQRDTNSRLTINLRVTMFVCLVR